MKNNFTDQVLKSVSSLSATFQFCLMLVLLILMAIINAGAQTVNPVRYWTFNGTSASTDSMGQNNLNFTSYGSQYTVGTNGQVGKFLTLDANSNLIDGGSLSLTNAVTVEFLLKPGYKFNTTNIMQRADGAFSIRIEYATLTFSTTHKAANGATIEDNFAISLEGLGRKSYGYYVDNNWHHLVFRFDAATGSKQVWVDGQLPAGFSKTITAGSFQNSGNINFYLNHSVSYVKYFGSIDELAIYNTAIPSNLIYKHYLGVQTGQPYNFVNNYSGTIPPASSTTSPLDPTEFAPGHPTVNVSAIEQLQKYPLPRYKPGNTLMKNFNWMDPKFMGGLLQPGVTNQQAANNSAVIQTELAKNFNYYFQVGLGNGIFETAWTNAANANPDFKLSLIIFRGQLNGNNSELTNQNKTAAHYLQNSSGQFIDANGNVTTSKIWRPTAPTSSYNADGNAIYTMLTDMYSRLNRNVDVVNENGEVFPHPSETAMAMDPAVLAAKNASGLDWKSFLSRKYKENETQSYRDIIMSHPRMSSAKFTEYAIDGFPEYRMKYSEARSVNSQINGQYYPTPDFYPRWSNNWRNWVSAWHGWQWIVESRVHELAAGDRLYSPFVAAGWDADEEKNIRPAQWLGLLKCLGMTGAEFYYPGFFSLAAPWPDSKNWIWQAAMPPYAQAITSRYEDLIRNGELMLGDVGNSYVTPTAPGYAFWTGDLRKLVVVRKHNTVSKYAITGTIQPNSSMTGNAENESVATITLDGQVLSFKVKRQGSTYIYDKSNPSGAIFYQLDGWHEKSHPSHWSHDFNLEAELFDNTNTQVAIKTAVPAGTAAGDYTNFTSYLAWPDGVTNPQPVEYNFAPRGNFNSNLYVWVRARSRGGVTSSMNVQLDNNAAKTIGCISDTAWTWYRYDACTQQEIRFQNISIQNHIIKLTPGNDKLEIDKVLLTADASLLLNSAPPSCGAATATITPSGNTTFCTGGTVTLTASAGTSYQWTPGGQTTQSIVVNASGSYNVTVGSGAGCAAIANAVTVSVVQAPSAQITTGGSTTLCPGASVTLTAPSGMSGYLWMPGGQTTQSITTSTAGFYTVRVTNAGGCSATSSPVNVTVGQTPVATITAGGTTSFCQGSSVTLTASAANSYLWFPGGQTTQSITASSTGNYTVRVTGSGGCTAMSNPSTVTVYALPTATISANGPTSFCTGGNVTLTAANATSYLWLPGGQTSQSINVTSAGSYSVRVTNSSGCSATSTATNVNVSAYPVATITPAGSTSLCAGSSVGLSASTGTAYLWTPGNQTTQTISATTAGAYTVRVTNSAGCSTTSQPTNITVNPAVNATISANGPTAILPGGSVTLTGAGGTSYVWSPGGQTTSSITVNTPGFYSVTAYSASGCSATSTPTEITLVNINTPPATITASNNSGMLCPGNYMTLTASAGSSYLWTPGGQTTQSINISIAGSYSVDITDLTGVTISSATFDVLYKPAPDAPAIMSAYIPSASFQLSAYEPTAHSYLWSNGATTDAITVNNTGTYTVRAINGFGCKSAPQTMTVTSLSSQHCGTPNMLSHYGITKTSAVVSWNPSVTADSFRVEYTRISTAQNFSVNVAGSQSKITLSGLTEGELYKWNVVAICSGIQTGSAIKQFTTLNGPLPCGSTPQNLSNDVVNSTMAKVSWFDTQADKFVIRYRAVGTQNYLYRRAFNSLTSGLIEGLTPSTNYEWSVRSACAGNVSLYSAPKFFTTPAACPAIGPFAVSEITFNKALVSWTPSTLVDSVMVKWAVSGTTDYRHVKIAASPDPGEYWILGLEPETTYDVWVATKCDAGSTSMWGAGDSFTTFTDPNLRFTPEAGAIHLNAYPNPTKFELSYVFESKDDKPYLVKVCDMAGRELLAEERIANEGKTGDKVDLPGFSGGLYMLIIQKGGQVGRFKFNIHE